MSSYFGYFWGNISHILAQLTIPCVDDRPHDYLNHLKSHLFTICEGLNHVKSMVKSPSHWIRGCSPLGPRDSQVFTTMNSSVHQRR